MEGLQKFVRNISKDPKSVSESPYFLSGGSSGGGVGVGVGTSAALSSDQSRVLVTRASRKVVSLWTCSKLCAIFFAAGVVVGYTLKRRVKRWASKLLKGLKDD
ncbi:hypothetical protein CFOL_v3_14454 [Cephalotus follicularis]|uniref:Transmembrane protein n=1 Tax=Cephalotus follicularis TaxID=3775 RepID=A0A1Q3BSL6_CEPFO|nr:hypothetical protein CFOL_v3_14454 [Cephalotus follicularis]